MRLRANRVVVFLLDETLFQKTDSSRLINRGQLETSLADSDVSRVTAHRGSGRSPAPGVANAHVEHLTESYQQHLPQIELRTDVVKLLEAINAESLLAVVADGPIATQRAKCQALQLQNHVDRIVYPDYWGRSFWVPHPRSLMSIQNCYGFREDQCTLVAGTGSVARKMAHRIGWQTFRFHTSVSKTGNRPPGNRESESQITNISGLIGKLSHVPDAA